MKTKSKMGKREEITYNNVQAINKKRFNHVYSNINTYNNLPSYLILNHPDLLGKISLFIYVFEFFNLFTLFYEFMIITHP